MEAVFESGLHKITLSSCIGSSCSNRKDTKVTYTIDDRLLIDGELWTLEAALDFAVKVTAKGFQNPHTLSQLKE